MQRNGSESPLGALGPAQPAGPAVGLPIETRSAGLPRTVPVMDQRAAFNRASPPAIASASSQPADTAAELHAALAAAYLDFRRVYYHEEAPTLDTLPPPHAEIRQAELARLTESILRVTPPALKSLPLVGGLIEHLQDVANLHSITERERTTLNNLTVAVLDGLADGIQPWFVEWRLETARRLSNVPDGEHFLVFPWESLLYLAPADLAELEEAARSRNVPPIALDMRRLTERLIHVLRDPIGTQPDLVFVGPGAEGQRLRFHLKTLVALSLAAYLVLDEAQRLFNPPARPATPTSALAPVPEQVQAHMLANGRP